MAANTSGGVTGKMISPQSIAVACAATGMVGRESELFRYTVKHSLIFASVIGIITLLQAYVFTGMLVSYSIEPDGCKYHPAFFISVSLFRLNNSKIISLFIIIRSIMFDD